MPICRSRLIFDCRSPRDGTYTSFSRTTLVELCVPTASNNFRPPVRALCIKTTARKKRGKSARAKTRGIYLIPAAKLFAYSIRKLPRRKRPKNESAQNGAA